MVVSMESYAYPLKDQPPIISHHPLGLYFVIMTVMTYTVARIQYQYQ